MQTNFDLKKKQHSLQPAPLYPYTIYKVLLDTWIYLDNYKYIIVVHLDYSSVFDTGNHKIVLKTFRHNGTRGTASQWCQTYLSDRQQFVSFWQCRISSSNLDLRCATRLSSASIIIYYIYKWYATFCKKCIYRHHLPLIIPYMLHPCRSQSIFIPLVVNEDLHRLAELFVVMLALNEQKYKYTENGIKTTLGTNKSWSLYVNGLYTQAG